MQAPSIDQWLSEAKQDPDAHKCGMYLVHNGVVRVTPKRLVREGIETTANVSALEFSYDEAGVAQAVEETLQKEGVYYVRTWLNRGLLTVGDPMMCVLVGADIRPRCISALEFLVEKIKTQLVVEREFYASEETVES